MPPSATGVAEDATYSTKAGRLEWIQGEYFLKREGKGGADGFVSGRCCSAADTSVGERTRSIRCTKWGTWLLHSFSCSTESFSGKGNSSAATRYSLERINSPPLANRGKLWREEREWGAAPPSG